MALSPDRSRAIALELARPIVEYVDQHRNNDGALLDTNSFRDHAIEFFEPDDAAKLSYCMMKELHNLCLWPYFIICLDLAPDAAVTIFAGMIQIHLIAHKIEERRLPEVRMPGSG